MKLNKEKEYLAEKVYERVEVLHSKDLLEKIDKIGKLKDINDLEELTNEIKKINVEISIQCLLVELIMQEDWELEEVKAIDYLLSIKEEEFLKEIVNFIIESDNPENLKSTFKLVLKTLYKLGDITYEK